MLYRMRCKNGLISNSSNRNQGCGEWDYSCNTYLTDSSLTDSVKATHPDYQITGFSGTSFAYSTSPTHTFIEFIQKYATAQGGNPDTVSSSETGSANLSIPLGGLVNNRKSQFLWTATELLNAGLTPGKINGLNLDLTQLGSAIRFLRIKLKATSQTSLATVSDNSGFTQVYFRDTQFTQTGLNRLQFYQPFTWDGTSNLLVEFNFSQTPSPTGNLVKGGNPGFGAAVSNPTNDHFLDFDGADSHINCGDIDALDSASRFTFEAWVNIKSWQNWTGIFKDNGKTVLETGDNVGQLYCIIRNPTNTYGYANNVIPLNTWTHVAMVFDGSKPTNINRLKLYVNGVQKTLIFSGTIPAKTENNQTPLTLARGVNCQLDDPRVWSVPVAGADIAAWFRRKVNAQHPNFSSLQGAWLLNEGNGMNLADYSPFDRSAVRVGTSVWRQFSGNEIFKNLDSIAERPNLNWIRNNQPIQTMDSIFLDSLPNLSKQVVHFQLINGQPAPIDTAYLYQSIAQNVYNEGGTIVRTIPAPTNGTLTISTLNYFRKSPQKIELMSFVTPFGIGLDFGMEGKMWEFDVTDYLHFLKGKKRISMERGGENQEDIDLRFVFIEGTPPRNVLNLTQIWPVTHSSYADINANRVFEERNLMMLPNTASFKIRSVITGHGQEGEFIPRNHSLNLNGGGTEFQWEVWKGCSLNPIIAQGGTWVYDRAGWCPGEPSMLQEWNANPHLQAGQSATFDYSVSPATGDSRYISNHQLVQYGPPNFNLDAAISQINAPSERTELGRRNPACMNPVVRITNTGATPLTSLTINYGLESGATSTYNWTGNLKFMESEEVILNVPNLGMIPGVFAVSCSNPNGGTDEYLPNNRLTSNYLAPIILPGKVIFELKSNAAPGENEYQITDANGNLVFTRNNLLANTIYRDTLELAAGCYEFWLLDGGNDGLAWWANAAQGTGYMRIRNGTGTGNGILKVFNPDFGGEAYQQFIVNPVTAVSENLKSISDFQLFPNPNSGKFTVDLSLSQPGHATLEVIDYLGKPVHKQDLGYVMNSNMEVNLSNLPSGIYMAIVQTREEKKVVRFVKN